jgi:hypothetical protein
MTIRHAIWKVGESPKIQATLFEVSWLGASLKLSIEQTRSYSTLA